MITITAKRLNAVLREFRRVLGIRKRVSFQPVTFTVGNDSLFLRSRTEDVVVGYQIGAQFDEAEFVFSLHDLSLVGDARCEVQFTRSDDQVAVSWEESRQAVSPTFQPFGASVYDECPKLLFSNEASLAQTLKHAAQTTDGESLRYSLGCVRLRSSDGQIAATDGRQAYLHSGFNLPPGELLVPAGALKAFSLLGKADSVSVGLRDDWVCFRIGVGDCRWSIDIKRLLTGRFPDIDRCMPRPESAHSTLSISGDDAQFLTEHLERLSSDPTQQGPITLDLGKEPVIRFKTRNLDSVRSSEDATRPKPGQRPSSGDDRVDRCEPRHSYRISELALTASQYTGLPIRCAVNHLHVLSALRYGFREFHFQSPEFPAFSYMGKRAYAWALCQASFALPPGRCDERLSPLAHESAMP